MKAIIPIQNMKNYCESQDEFDQLKFMENVVMENRFRFHNETLKNFRFMLVEKYSDKKVLCCIFFNEIDELKRLNEEGYEIPTKLRKQFSFLC